MSPSDVQLERIVRAVSRRYFWPGATREDVEQEARLALVQAQPDDPTLAWVIAERHLVEQVRRETRRRPQFSELRETVPARENVVELVEARDRLRSVLGARLTDRERYMVGRAIRGETLNDAKWMDNALYSARRKLAA